MAARRFEYSEGRSNKFWEVWTDRSTVKTRYGKIGAAGQTSARKTAGPIEADELRDKLVAEKLRKGYVEKRGAKASGKAAEKKPGKAAAKTAKSTKAVYRGKRFTDEDLSYQDLERADLSRSRWRSSAFDGANLQRANLQGAVFEDCTFDGTELDEVRASAATFTRCKLDVEMRNADLRDAKFLALAPDCAIDIAWSKATRMRMEVTLSDPRRANWIVADDADLRGATFTFGLAPGAKSKGDWYRGLAESGKTDAKTRIDYAPLAGAKPQKRGAPGLAESGPRGEPIGTLHAQSASLWFLAVDSAAAADWRGDEGYDYDDDSALPRNLAKDKSDFGRALYAATKKSGVLRVGKGEGIVATVGGGGWSPIWRIEGGLALLDYAPDDDVDERAKLTLARLALAVAQLPPKGKPKHVGSVKVTSGVLALLLPAENGDIPPALVAKAAKSAKSVAANPSRALVPLEKGTYDVFVDAIAFEEEGFGSIDRRVRIVAH